MKSENTINILSDICLTKDNISIFEKKKPENLFNGIHKMLKMGSFNIANLEAPLATEHDKPIIKTGPNLFNSESVIDTLKAASFHALSLANNHILDYGGKALLKTISKLERSDIKYFGAGKNSAEGRKPIFINVEDLKIGFYALAENEFSIATSTSAGANGLDYFNSFDDILEIKKSCDYLIVIFHGGIEYHPYPSPLLQKTCRKMVSCGADLVLCQHSHCIGSKEEYLNGTILYGQGNAIFGYKKDQPFWNEGLIVQLSVNTKKVDKINFIPIKALIKGGIDLMNKQELEKVMAAFEQRSNEIKNEGVIEEKWLEFCAKKKNIYYPAFYGFNRWMIHLNRLTKNKLVDALFSPKRKMITHNLIRCESHHEVISTLLKSSYEK